MKVVKFKMIILLCNLILEFWIHTRIYYTYMLIIVVLFCIYLQSLSLLEYLFLYKRSSPPNEKEMEYSKIAEEDQVRQSL